MATKFSTVITGNSQMDRVQANTSQALQQITGPYIGGNLLTAIAVGTSPTVINHKLGRVPQLWTLADQDTLTNVKRISWNTNSITLEAGSSCTISFWIN